MCAEKASFHIGCRGFLLMSFLVLITKRDVGCSGTRCFATSLHATTCLLLRVTNKAFYVKKKQGHADICFYELSCAENDSGGMLVIYYSFTAGPFDAKTNLWDVFSKF